MPEEVEILWDRIAELERQLRFDGRPYPSGMASFPGRMRGQAFFPGGDGLWREEDCIADRATIKFPLGGIMFLGNDFGTLASFEVSLRRGHERNSVPTWRHLRARLVRAGIPGNLGFYTNSMLGLRTEGGAIDDIDWSRNARFGEFCGEFLKFQIEIIRPRLVVVLGPRAKNAVCAALSEEMPALILWRNRRLACLSAMETIVSGKWRGRNLVLHLTSHPYSDFGKNGAQKGEDAARLAQAWREAQRCLGDGHESGAE